jgi:magnesium-transporting ATPase (P-type)
MEAMLTGESIAIEKNTEDKQELFMGTIVQG